MAERPKGFVPDAPAGFVPDTPAPAPQKGIFGLPRSEPGKDYLKDYPAAGAALTAVHPMLGAMARGQAGRVVNFLGNDIFFLGNPPQTAGDVGMIAGLLAVPLAGPALTRMGMSTVARGFAKLPGFLQRIALGAVGDELASDLTGRQPLQGLREGAQGAAVGEAIGLGIRGGIKATGGIGRAAVAGGTYLGKKVPGLKDVIKGRERKATLAERMKRQDAAKVERDFKAKEAKFEAEQRQRESALQEQYDGLLSKWNKEKDVVTKRNMAAQLWHVDDQIQKNLDVHARGVAREIGTEVGKIVPPDVMPFSTAREMSRAGIFHKDTRKNLGKHQEAALAEHEPAFGDFTYDLPMIAKPDPTKVKLREALEEQFRRGMPSGAPLPDYFVQELNKLVGMKTRFTPREFVEELGRIGPKGWTPQYQKEGTKPGVEWRAKDAAMRAAAKEQADAAGLGAAHDGIMAGRKAFSVGNTLTQLSRMEGMFERRAPAPGTTAKGGVLLDEDGLKKIFRQHAQEVKDRTTADEYKAVEGAIFRGQDITTRPGPRLEGGRVIAPTPQILDIPAPPPGQAMPGKPIVPVQTRVPQPPQRPAATTPLAPSRPWTYPFSVSELGQVYLDMTMANNMRIAPVEPMSEEKGQILSAIGQAGKPPEGATRLTLQPGLPAGPATPPPPAE